MAGLKVQLTRNQSRRYQSRLSHQQHSHHQSRHPSHGPSEIPDHWRKVRSISDYEHVKELDAGGLSKAVNVMRNRRTKELRVIKQVASSARPREELEILKRISKYCHLNYLVRMGHDEFKRLEYLDTVLLTGRRSSMPGCQARKKSILSLSTVTSVICTKSSAATSINANLSPKASSGNYWKKSVKLSPSSTTVSLTYRDPSSAVETGTQFGTLTSSPIISSYPAEIPLGPIHALSSGTSGAPPV